MERFIRFMADNGVLQFGEFKLKCGRISPYYINTGNYKSAAQISKLGEFYAECMRENNVESNLLIGNTYKEIPIMISASMLLFNRYGMDINYSIDHSVGKQLESNDKVTMIKDTLTSGNTIKCNLQYWEYTEKHPVSDVIISVDRMERSIDDRTTARHKLEKEFNIKIHAIVTLDDIVQAIKNGIVGSTEYMDSIEQYRDQYRGDSYGN